MPQVIWDLEPGLLIGDQLVRYYSLCMIASFFAGYALLTWQMKRGGGDIEESGDFLNYGIIGLLVGARVGHVVFYDLERFFRDPLWIFEIWKGGLASHGALVGLALAMLLFTKRRAIPFLDGTDRLVFAGALGAALMRVGNLFNSEIVGKRTDGSWGFAFPRYDNGDLVFRHPSQLYEVALGILVLGALVLADRAWGRERRPRGALTGLFFAAYFTGRFVVEFSKEPQLGEGNHLLNMGQVLSGPLALFGVLLLVRSLRLRRAAGWTVAERVPHLAELG